MQKTRKFTQHFSGCIERSREMKMKPSTFQPLLCIQFSCSTPLEKKLTKRTSRQLLEEKSS